LLKFTQDFAALAKIYLCGFCLQYFKTAEQLCRHCSKSVDVHVPHPPGDEIYRKGKLSIWEIDGRKNKVIMFF
jgi:histone acetyltransferase MYST2